MNAEGKPCMQLDTGTLCPYCPCQVDYRGWYDKVKIVLKEVTNCQYAAAMNPTAGSFNITPRMQRHFATFAVQMPGADIVRSIYSQVVEGHLGAGSFDGEVVKMGPKLVDATIELHRLVGWGAGWGLVTAASDTTLPRAPHLKRQLLQASILH